MFAPTSHFWRESKSVANLRGKTQILLRISEKNWQVEALICPSRYAPSPPLESTNVALCCHLFLQIIACTIVHFLHFYLFEGDKLLVCGVPDKTKIYLFLVLEPARVFFSRTWVVCSLSSPIIAPAKTWTRIRHLLNGQGKGDQRTQTG